MNASCRRAAAFVAGIGLLAALSAPVAAAEPAPPRARPPDFIGPVLGDGFCFDCLERNFAQFRQLTARFKRLPKPAQPERIDDFIVSRVGILIHEDCIKAFGDRLDVEQVVTDTVITGFQCMIDRKHEADRRARRGEFDFANGGAAYREHIPRLLNLFTQHAVVNDVVTWGYGADGAWARVDLRDPCREFGKLGYPTLALARDCSKASEVPLGQPKLFCGIDALSDVVTRRHHASPESSRALATLPQMAYPIYKNWQGKTRVYNAPMITFLPLTHDMDAGTFMSTLWHELAHNIGYEHGSETQMDPYYCQTACFWHEHAARWQPPLTRIHAAQACATNRLPQQKDRDLADEIGRAFGDR